MSEIDRFLQGKRLNLGCGKKKITQNCTNIDINLKYDPDICFNLEAGLPSQIEDDSIIEVYAHHVMEHLNNFIKVMRDIHRVCKKGAIVHITSPHSQGLGAWQDPTHVRALNENTWKYFDEWHLEYDFPHFRCVSCEVDDDFDQKEMRVKLEVVK